MLDTRASDREVSRVLMFHRVREPAPTAFSLPDCYRIRGTSLSIDELERALDTVGVVTPLAAVEHALTEGYTPPTGSVLTFDDGYREHLDLVAPLLASRGQTATFYVATDLCATAPRAAAVDAWYWLLDHAEASHACIPLPGNAMFSARVDTIAGKSQWVMGPPKRALLSATAEGQQKMLDALAAELGCALPRDLATQLYLGREDWSTLADWGMRVGAHSMSHPHLTGLDDVRLAREVRESLRALSPLGEPVPFAYPDGDYDARVLCAVERWGASSAVTCEAGVVTGTTGLMRLPRMFVPTPTPYPSDRA